MFAIYTCGDWRLVGLSQLNAIDNVNGTAEFHVTILHRPQPACVTRWR